MSVFNTQRDRDHYGKPKAHFHVDNPRIRQQDDAPPQSHIRALAGLETVCVSAPSAKLHDEHMRLWARKRSPFLSGKANSYQRGTSPSVRRLGEYWANRYPCII
ncbi:hypothetical protein QNH14_01500 [Apirhabdus apintestini]|nr:hypothetical protein QNH14_01500 [Enterobacteriaceae bacterium CA-0114]